MEQLHFGARIETGIPSYEDASALAILAEAVGYDSVWVRDHVAVPEIAPLPDCLECFTTMAGFARDTKRVLIGSLVSCVPWRNPALVAKMGATIDVMSGGRFILGLGAGGSGAPLAREFARYGWHHASPGQRARSVAEAAIIARRMWTEPAPSFRGEFFTIDEAICEPRPITRPHPPILIGASGEKVGLRNVARHADIWNSTALLPDYASKTEALNRVLAEEGRDPATLRRAANQTVIICPEADVQRRVERLVNDWGGRMSMADRVIAGTPEMVAERIRPYLELGADMIITYFWEPDIAAQKECTEAFGKEVIPLLRQL